MISHLYPTSTPSLNLNFKASRVVDPRISCTRSTTATYVDPVSGLLKTAAANEARVDKDGLLSEEAKTNIIQDSAFQNSSYWSTTGTAPTYNSGTAPDGTNTAALMPAGNNQLYTTFYLTPTHTFSVWVKSAVAGVHGTSQIVLSRGQGTPEAFTAFTTTDTWQRISVTRNSTGSLIGLFCTIGQWSNQNGPTQDILVWGAQVEESQLTSYIPTNGSAVQRLADDLAITGTNFSSWYNQSETTLVMHQSIDKTNGQNLDPWRLDGSGSLRGQVGDGVPANGLIYMDVWPTFTGYLAGYSTGNNWQISQQNKAAFSWRIPPASNPLTAQTEASGSLNGQSAVTANNMAPIGNRTAFKPLYANSGTIEYISFYPTKVSDTALETLTK